MIARRPPASALRRALGGGARRARARARAAARARRRQVASAWCRSAWWRRRRPRPSRRPRPAARRAAAAAAGGARATAPRPTPIARAAAGPREPAAARRAAADRRHRRRRRSSASTWSRRRRAAADRRCRSATPARRRRRTSGGGNGTDRHAPPAPMAPVPAYEVTTMPLPQGRCMGIYTDEARQAAHRGHGRARPDRRREGRARATSTSSAGLAHGLTEAAIAAIKGCHFNPGREGRRGGAGAHPRLQDFVFPARRRVTAVTERAVFRGFIRSTRTGNISWCIMQPARGVEPVQARHVRDLTRAQPGRLIRRRGH